MWASVIPQTMTAYLHRAWLGVIRSMCESSCPASERRGSEVGKRLSKRGVAMMGALAAIFACGLDL